MIQVAPLSQGELVGGRSGLSNEIDAVTVLEVNWIEVPESQSLARNSDLIISSMYSVMNSVSDQIKMIRLLVEHHSSALVLCHLGIVIKELSPLVIAECDRLGLPLIVMPPNTIFSEIITSVSDALRGFKSNRLSSEIALYDSIMALLLKPHSTRNLIQNLGRMIGCPALYFNHNLKAEETADLPEDFLSYIRKQVRKNTLAFMDSYEETLVPGYEGGPPLLLIPLYSNIFYFGVIVILKRREFTDLDESAIFQTKNALHIAHLNQTNVFEEHARLLNEYIDDLVHGYCENGDVIKNRSVALKHDISHTQAALVVDIFEFSRLTEGMEESRVQNLKKAFCEHMDNLLASLTPLSIGCSISDMFVILFTENLPEEKLRQRLTYVCSAIQGSLQESLQLGVSIGVGSFCDSFGDIRASYQAALSAIHISNRLYCAPRIAFSQDYAVYAFLMNSLQGQSSERRLRELEEQLFLPLRSYDEKNSGSLEETYRMLLKCDMDTNLVAQKMFIHKNTVLQRKKKISSLYAQDPFAIANRMQFQFVCLLDELLQSGHGSSGLAWDASLGEHGDELS
jgi:purine catabolism regulator